MAEPTAYLLEWTERFLKNKDLIHRKIADIKKEGKDLLLVDHKDGIRTTYLITPSISPPAPLIRRAKEKGKCVIVTYNTKENIGALKAAWSEYTSLPRDLHMIFVNPLSLTEKRWMIYPHTHNLLSDKETLMSGIDSLASTVDLLEMRQLATLPEE